MTCPGHSFPRARQGPAGGSSGRRRQAMQDLSPLGAKIRGLRRQRSMTQAHLAERLGISASYLNLIEHNKRRLSAPLLIKLAEVFDLDLRALSAENHARVIADLMEVFGDPIFESHDVTNAEVRDLCASTPAAARGVLALYQAYRAAREASDTLAATLSDGDLEGVDSSHLPTEEVSDLIQRRMNQFPELEAGAEALWREAVLDRAAADAHLTSESSRALARVALANYFAGAVLMPYQPFLEAARAEKYDIELLGHRFRSSFEQTCHRLT